jgi:CheY-like chemotaxis protein
VDLEVPSLRGLTVLVVDDEPDAHTLLRKILTQYEAQVIEVDSAEGALAALKKAVPDVIISDVGLPDEDGYSLIRRIRSLPEPVRRVPAVALSAFARMEDRQRALLSGFQMHLAKPIAPAELITVVASLAGRT